MDNNELNFQKNVITHLAKYKQDILKIKEDVEVNDHFYKHILTNSNAHKNLMIASNEYNIESNEIVFNKKYNDKKIVIDLHDKWSHLNSSQILCINYFYKFLENKELLKRLLNYLNIKESPEEAVFELLLEDQTQVDFAIKLENGKFVYFEIKYSEKEFGQANNVNQNYPEKKEKFHKDVLIDYLNYIKYYQFVRMTNIAKNENITVLLYPKDNLSIIENIKQAKEEILNYDKFNVKEVLWEDLLLELPDEKIYEKYFLVNKNA